MATPHYQSALEAKRFENAKVPSLKDAIITTRFFNGRRIPLAIRFFADIAAELKRFFSSGALSPNTRYSFVCEYKKESLTEARRVSLSDEFTGDEAKPPRCSIHFNDLSLSDESGFSIKRFERNASENKRKEFTKNQLAFGNKL